MMMAADVRDDEDGVRRDAGGQYRAHWAVNRQLCPTRRNGNDGFNGSVSVLHRVAADKELSHPAYWMRYQNNGNGVSTGLLGAGL